MAVITLNGSNMKKAIEAIVNAKYPFTKLDENKIGVDEYADEIMELIDDLGISYKKS